MLVACDISKQMGVLKEAGFAEKLESLLIKFNLPTFYKALTVEALFKAMGYDKKAEGGVNRFVLPISLGNTTIVRGISQDVIREALLRRKH
jgi:3-dehydroquinate synthase